MYEVGDRKLRGTDRRTAGGSLSLIHISSKAASCEAERQALQSKITALTTNLDQMYTDRLSGLLSEEDFQRIYQKVKMDRTVLEDRLKSLQSSR